MVLNAGDTFPPNLQQLFVNDCLSTTPLLHLARLKVLRISDHCHMPAAELQRLSTLTQLESVRLGYNTWRRYRGERAAQEASPGWLAVSGVLQELHLRSMEVDVDRGLLPCLARLTALTSLVWDSCKIRLDPMDEDGDDGDNGIVTLGMYLATTDHRDGGLRALSECLPQSLRDLRFRTFLPDVFDTKREPEIILGLTLLVEAAEQLPNLESCSFDDNALVHGFCRGGEELVGRLLARGNAICAADRAVEQGADGGVQAAGGDDGFHELFMDTFPMFFR
jgi:hypothetical protein